MTKLWILGTGKQGTADAYDILLYAVPKQLILLDSNTSSLKDCISKIKFVKSNKTEIISKVIDLNDKSELIKMLFF